MVGIGSFRRDARAFLEHFGLAPFRSILRSEDFTAAAQASRCTPMRKRALTPETVAWLMMYVGLVTTSMRQGLCRAWGLVGAVCPWMSEGCVTEEAFCLARKHLPLRFWRELWQHLRVRFEAEFQECLLWKGVFRLLAIDGCGVDLPRAKGLSQYFGTPSNQHGDARQPQAKLVALCSMFTGFCLAFKFVSQKFTEHRALRHLFRQLRPNDLVMMDCGLFSYAAIWQIPLRGAHYLMRIASDVPNYTEAIQLLGHQDWLVLFRPSRQARLENPGVPHVLVARLIRYQIPGYRPSWLLTSLIDAADCPAEELVSLYHRRWEIETIYREWKHTLDVQNLRSHKPARIMREVYAQLILSNLIRWVMTEAALGTGRHAVDYSFTSTLNHVNNALLRMLRSSAWQVPLIYQQLLDDIRSAKILKRPGRSYPRRDDKPRNKGKGAVRKSCRLTEAERVEQNDHEDTQLSKVA